MYVQSLRSSSLLPRRGERSTAPKIVRWEFCSPFCPRTFQWSWAIAQKRITSHQRKNTIPRLENVDILRCSYGKKREEKRKEKRRDRKFFISYFLPVLCLHYLYLHTVLYLGYTVYSLLYVPKYLLIS